MAHFNLRQGLFQSPHEESIYVNGRENEYIRYDYSFEEDIVPAINKLFPDNEPIPEGRPLQNVKVFLQGSLIGLCFKDFDFSDINSAGALFAATSAPYISVLYFVNCRLVPMAVSIFQKPVLGFMIVCLMATFTSVLKAIAWKLR